MELWSSPCKINLCLKIFEKRPDGFHRVETLMAKLGFCDQIQFSSLPNPGLRVVVTDHPRLSNEYNLAHRAASLYLEKAKLMDLGLEMTIQKNVFLAAGLGGGSANAATTLAYLQGKLQAFSEPDLMTMAASLGADVAFLLAQSDWACAFGKGERLVPWPALPRKVVLLVNPGMAISTAEMYEKLRRSSRAADYEKTHLLNVQPARTWDDVLSVCKLGNDLQPLVQGQYPIIGHICEEMMSLGASWAQMSGSGATIFALFDEEEQAQKAAESLRSRGKVIITWTGNQTCFKELT